jgi:hypothetical protein
MLGSMGRDGETSTQEAAGSEDVRLSPLIPVLGFLEVP